jgi:hypothetical protein
MGIAVGRIDRGGGIAGRDRALVAFICIFVEPDKSKCRTRQIPPNDQASVQSGRLCPGQGAAFDNGLLQIELVREIPEAMKPRRIEINGSAGSNVQQIDTKAA